VEIYADTDVGIEAIRTGYLNALDRLDTREAEAEVATMVDELERFLRKKLDEVTVECAEAKALAEMTGKKVLH
jgi:hypothetical protein